MVRRKNDHSLMGFLSNFSKNPSKEDLCELNRFFHEETLSAVISSYYSGFDSKSNFDFLTPSRFIYDDSGVNKSLLSGITSREIKGHAIKNIRLFSYETQTNNPYICSILVADTDRQIAQYYSLTQNGSGYDVFYNGTLDKFLATEISRREDFEKCIIETTKVEQKYRSLGKSSSNCIISSLPNKKLTDVFTIDFQDKLNRHTSNPTIMFAKSLKIYFNPRAGIDLIERIFVDYSGFFYIFPVGECIVIICRKGFKDPHTIHKIRWMFTLPIFQDSFTRTDSLIFIDPLTNQHEFLDVRSIDLSKL